MFVYQNADGTARREYRPPEEVFHPDSLESFALVPVTDDHPTEVVTADNAKRLTVGIVGENVRVDDTSVIATVTVFDAATISKIDSGKQQLSCGYHTKLDWTPGVTPDGERYDCIQREIRGNHVALVETGRAGTARLHLDSADVASDDDTATLVELPEIKLDKQDNTRMEELEKAQARVAELEATLAKTENDLAIATANFEMAEKMRADAASDLESKVRQRVTLETRAAEILGPQDFAGKPSREIMLAVVKHVDRVDVAPSFSDDYVAARFDSCVERAKEAAANVVALRGAVATSAISDKSPERIAHEKLMAQLKGQG